MQMASSFYLVGIGASAGGLEALEQFFKALKTVDNIAFVVIQHLSPDYKSYMPELISKFTTFKVCPIQDHMELVPGCIFLNPPKYNVKIQDDRFLLLEQSPTQKINQSVDTFFYSIAEYMGEKSIGIILSGSGSDGTRGCRAIKEAGGIVMVQEESSARFSGMPKNVIASKMYDYILTPRNMPEALIKYIEKNAVNRSRVTGMTSRDSARESKMNFEFSDFIFPGINDKANAPVFNPPIIDDLRKAYRPEESDRNVVSEALKGTVKEAYVDNTASLIEEENGSYTTDNRNSVSETAEDREVDDIYSALIEEYLPPSVIVDEKDELIQVCGDAGKYLRVPKGRVYYDIKKMVPRELSSILGSVLEKVRSGRNPVTLANIRFSPDQEFGTVNLNIRPLTNKKNSALILITFEEPKYSAVRESYAGDYNFAGRLHKRIIDLEQELGYTKEYLQNSINDLKTANRELLTTNKALKSENEELLMDNQELVEATTQYQIKLQELTEHSSWPEAGDDCRLRLPIKDFLNFSAFAVLVVKNNAIQYVNTEGLNLLQVKSEQQVIGRSLSSYINIDEEMLNERYNAYRSEQVCKMEPLEEKLIRPDGTLVYVEITAMPVSYEAEDSLLLILKDVNFRKLSEQLKDDYLKSRKQLEEARLYDSMKNDFFSNLSHELRTPLNVIMSTLQLMESIMNNNKSLQPTAKTKKYMDIMKQNCYRQLRLINNLIDITKIEAGFYEVEMRNYDIINIVENITLSVSEYVKTKSIELIFDTEVEEKIIACNPDSIERIMLNLLSNAIKFTNEGGSITVTMFDRNDWVVISIKDSGIGIPQEKLNIIFERFKQAEKSLTRGQGSGIGLSLVKSLVELHGGKIDVKSQPGNGSEFIIQLPASKIQEENYPMANDPKKQQQDHQDHVDKINIEFSDIYNLN